MPANAAYGLQFWRDEVDRAERISAGFHAVWQKNLDHYVAKDKADGTIINVNVDFYETEQKNGQLFFDSPELQFAPGAGFDATASGVIAFRKLVNVLLGGDYIDALETVLISLKRCQQTSGNGATIIGYQPTIQQVPSEGIRQPGAVLELSQPVPVPVHEAWFWDAIPDKKFLRPADFHATEFDKAPWLGMRFRLPLKAAKLICNLPPNFTGTQTKDEHVLEVGSTAPEAGTMAYVDGTIVWYKAYLFDDDEIHPEIYRRHILIDGLETFADKDDPAWRSPYQTKLPNGRLRADSMSGNPIHVFTLRSVPDSAYVPSDAQMRRALVSELNLFREQMLRERDVNSPKFAYNATTFPPDAIAKIEQAMTGSLIPLPAESFQGDKVVGFALLAQGSSPRQTYLANDYIERDIAKTSGMDSAGVGVDDGHDETATKTTEIAKARNVRLDAERKRILRQYLKGVDKVAALALRFCSDPQRVAELIGPESAMAYLQWRALVLEQGDVRPKFTAKPDSQIKLDAAKERKFWLDAYNFMAKDPLMNRAALLRKVITLCGEDPSQYIAQEPPESKPEPSLGYSFKGEDLNPMAAQFPIVLEVLAQCGVEISPQTIQEAQDGALNQLLMQQMMPTDASAKPGQKKPAEHGGVADKMGPLSKHSAEQTGNRAGPSVEVQ